jgi:hypothetical protein
MISVNSRGSIFYVTNLKFFSVFMIFKTWLNGCLTIKFWLFKLIGVVNIKNSILFFQRTGILHHVFCP